MDTVTDFRIFNWGGDTECESAWGIDIDDGFGIIGGLIALVAIIFAAGGYVIYVAPQLLPDVALHVLLAPALNRAAKRAESRRWLTEVIRSTWIALVAVLLLTMGLAAAIHQHCPGASKLMDAIACS